MPKPQALKVAALCASKGRMAIGSKRFEICATETAPWVSSKTRDKEKQTFRKEGPDPSNPNPSKRTSSLVVKSMACLGLHALHDVVPQLSVEVIPVGSPWFLRRKLITAWRLDARGLSLRHLAKSYFQQMALFPIQAGYSQNSAGSIIPGADMFR